ncbi:MAG: hypothetical protein V1753_11660 [Pseudomonadota bacterium]
MDSEVLNFHANVVACREVFLLNFREELSAFEQSNVHLLNLIRVVGKDRDKDGNSHVGLLPLLMIMSRQGLNSFEAISTYRSYQAWVSLRPSLECALIIGKWYDDPSNAKIWSNREKDWKAYQKVFSGKALLSKSLPGCDQIRSVLTRINDDFMHTNPRYYFRHTQTNKLDTKNILLQVRFNDYPAEHKAHLYAFLHLTRFLVSSLGEMFSIKFGVRQDLKAAIESMQDHFRLKVKRLTDSNPEAKTVLIELGLWPDSCFSD